MARWVTPCFAMASSIAGGVGCSIVAVAAPKRSGNIRLAPSPKVKAIGAEVMTMSPGFSARCAFAKVSHGARMSRWKWTQPLGTPVVPLVKAISAGSSCARVVGRQRVEPGAARFQFALAIVAVIADEVLDEMRLLHRFAEVADEAAVDDRVADLRALDDGGDLAWAEQRHGRDDHPARLEHAEPRREQGEAVGAAQQDAVAGDEAVFGDEQPRDAARERVELGIGPAAALVDHRERVGRAALEQFGGGVEALGIIEQVEARQIAGCGEAVADEGVVSHSGTTAVASISTIARGSTRRDDFDQCHGRIMPADDRFPCGADLGQRRGVSVDRGDVAGQADEMLGAGAVDVEDGDDVAQDLRELRGERVGGEALLLVPSDDTRGVDGAARARRWRSNSPWGAASRGEGEPSCRPAPLRDHADQDQQQEDAEGDQAAGLDPRAKGRTTGHARAALSRSRAMIWRCTSEAPS